MILAQYRPGASSRLTWVGLSQKMEDNGLTRENDDELSNLEVPYLTAQFHLFVEHLGPPCPTDFDEEAP